MNKLLRNGVLFLLFCIAVSCEKEVFITDSQRIADELKSVVGKNKIEYCNIYLFENSSREIEHGGVTALTIGRSPKNKYLSKKKLTITAKNYFKFGQPIYFQ